MAAAALAVVLAAALALVPEAEPEEVAVAVADEDELVVPLLKVCLVESSDPQVSSISVVHASWPVLSMGWSAIQVPKAD